MRDFLIIIGVSAVAIVVGVLLFFFGPKSLQSDIINALNSGRLGPAGATQFVVLTQGATAISVTDRTNYRITSQADLQALWPLIYGDKDAPQIPTIDFNKYEVLAIFDGTHSSFGYSIKVTSIADNAPTRTVTIEHLAPATSCAVQTGVSSPFEIIRVPKTTSNLAHQDTTGTSICSSN